jgi:carboxyl-terminal processing protease
LTAFAMGYDPHTSYFSKSTFENFEIEMRLQLEGIGATLASTDDGLTEIKRIVPGGAADKSGAIKVDDKIVAVGQGTEGEMVDVTDMKLNDVVHMIRGEAGTIVRLSILSPDSTEVKSLTITREKIELKDSEARGVVFDAGKKADGSPYKIGVIDLPSFYSDMDEGSRGSNYKSTTRDLRRILGEFKQQNVDAVVLDLTTNGGGSLREAIDSTGLFIDRGPVVQVKDSYGQVRALNDTAAGMAWDGPLVVMCSKFSASASEILAGAVQDYQRGIVIGDSSTHGKGTVQNLIDLNQEIFQVANPTDQIFGALKVTMQQFYRPQGDSTQKRGVLSDIVLPSITDHMEISESDLDYSMDFDKVPEVRFERLKMVNSDILERIRQKSAERRQASEDFTKRNRAIELYVEQREKKTLPLSEEKFFARRQELDADKEDEKLIEAQANPGEIERDFFMDEILNIAVDYIEELNAGGVAVK